MPRSCLRRFEHPACVALVAMVGCGDGPGDGGADGGSTATETTGTLGDGEDGPSGDGQTNPDDGPSGDGSTDGDGTDDGGTDDSGTDDGGTDDGGTDDGGTGDGGTGDGEDGCAFPSVDQLDTPGPFEVVSKYPFRPHHG